MMYDPTMVFMIGYAVGGVLGVMITAFIFAIGTKGDDE
jgi:hypothetical protein